MVLFPIIIFLSAFLLFQVQPLMGKFILPWFGGGPAVWTACLLFFQLLLLGGYLYAHLTSAWLPLKVQGWLHAALLAASLIVLPIVPSAKWKPLGAGDPTAQILLLLLLTVGLPYFLLSTTGPLLQRWFSVCLPGRSPYRLYALSNAGSFLALLTYPVAFEPYFRLGLQTQLWSWSYSLFAALCAWCAWRMSGFSAAEASPEAGADAGPAPDWGTLLFWLALSACGSILLLSTTSQMCQEVAVVPFLWILPLAIYLLAFIVCFEHDRWYGRRWCALSLALVVPFTCKVLVTGLEAPLWQHIPLYTITLAAGCLCSFGELVRSKPHPRYLTLFYLLIAVGGALGGIFVALAAPRIFVENREYHLGLALCGALTLTGWWRSRAWEEFAGRPFWVAAPMTGLLAMSLFALVAAAYGRGYSSLRTERNFYGILRVSEHSDEVGTYYSLSHGGTLHGFQYLDSDKREWPTSYYGPDSAVGLALNLHPARKTGRGLRVAVIGLGTGSIAVHGRSGDTFRFYEINPIVERLSKTFFTYRMDSKAKVEIDMGDARVRLEDEAAHGELQNLDVLAVDAFSSDAIPSHLLTAECAELYKRHLKPDGILVIHISNRFLDLSPVVRALAQRLGWQAARVDSERDDSKGIYSATWILVTGNQEFLRNPEVSLSIDSFTKEDKRPLLWTDDFVSLWRILK
jgi:spermidine synthase